jgi:hypothetical protein
MYIVAVVDVVSGDKFVYYGQVPLIEALLNNTAEDGLISFC